MKKRRSSQRGRWWVLVIAYRGIIGHVQACKARRIAIAALARHLREDYGYRGKAQLPEMAEWVAQHQPELDVQISEQDSSPLHSDYQSLESLMGFLASRVREGGGHSRMVRLSQQAEASREWSEETAG